MHPESKTLLIGLAHEGLIRISGADAAAFLQGQLSTDIEKLTPNQGQFSSWSNAKGRVVTLLRLLRIDDDIFMSLPQDLAVQILKRLSMYVLRAKVKITDAGKDIASFGLVGSAAVDMLTRANMKPPQGNFEVSFAGGIHVLRLHGSLPRYALYGAADDIFLLQKHLLAGGATSADEDAWALHKILAGEPTVYAETSEHFVAQMLNLDKLGAVDFKKGCYIGQEVIARAHYRGAVKRHMIRASCRSSVSVTPGTPLQRPGADQSVAEVVDARVDAEGLTQMLAVLQDEYRDGPLSLATGDAINSLPESETA